MRDEDRFWFDHGVAGLAENARREWSDSPVQRQTPEPVPSAGHPRQNRADEVRIFRYAGGEQEVRSGRMRGGSPVAPLIQQPPPRQQPQHRRSERDESPLTYRRSQIIPPERN